MEKNITSPVLNGGQTYNNSNFIVSVIMPVYNAEKYVEEAVLSAVMLDAVGELILVEDGSKDSSLSICKKLATSFEKVKLFVHEGNKNKGASESRNLGIMNAKFDFVSFLDADDVYCKHRFNVDDKVFNSNKSIDGVYSAVGYLNEPEGKVFTLTKEIPSGKLFHYLLRGTFGHFHTNGITVKKNVFENVGYFNPELILHQDSEMWLRMSFSKTLYAGELKSPVALIRRHEGNRIWKGQNNATRILAYRSFLNWVVKKNIANIDLFILVRKISLLENIKGKPAYFFTLIKNLTNEFLRKFNIVKS